MPPATAATIQVALVPAPPVYDDVNAWPSWVVEAMDRMDNEKNVNYGGYFKRAVDWWVVFERSRGWVTSTKGLPTDERPAEVANWLRIDRRNLKKIPTIADETQYAAQWRAWWKALQPDWRSFDADNRLEQVGSGEWGVLDHPGKNGVLMTLLSLMWWRDIATSQTLHDWHHAARDVAWTIWQMALVNSRYVCP
ncbi:hypothetical protein C8Q70DRAFT_906185 [Cubamyces menziesii]|nr:hypothetical protein C8Q70DRAFT_906185 [Cubamyces menziesii]